VLIVGLDLSLTSSGVVRLGAGVPTDPGGNPLHSLHRVQSKAVAGRDTAAKSRRLRTIAGEVTALCAGADLALVEGPSYGSEGRGTWDRAGLWWLVVARLTGAGLNVVEIPPSNLKQYVLGKGGGKDTGKDQMLAAVIRRYPWAAVDGNDVADALGLAAMGARFAQHPVDELPAKNLTALRGIAWAPNERG